MSSGIVTKLIADIRHEAGSGGAVAILQMLRELPVYKVEQEAGVGDDKGLPHPMPMAFAEAWHEMFDLLLVEAQKQWGEPR